MKRVKPGIFCASVFVCFLSLSLGAPRAGADADGGGGSGLGQPGAVILATSTVGEDLSVAVDWSPDITAISVEIALFDGTGAQVEALVVSPVAGEHVQYVVPEFLSRVPAGGFQFSVALRIPSGEDISAAHGFRVFFDCSLNGPSCAWETVDGLEASSPTMREAMLQGLDAATAAGSTDLLADLLAGRPDLTGQIVSFVAQLDQLDRRLNLGPNCFCSWVDAFFKDLSYSLDNEDGTQKAGWQTKERVSEGLNLQLGGQAHSYPGTVNLDVFGSSRLSFSLRCWQFVEWTEYTVPMAGGSASRSLRFPRVVPCLDTCSGEITFSSKTEIQLDIAGLQNAGGEEIIAETALEGSLQVFDGASNLGFVDSWGLDSKCEGDECPLIIDHTSTSRELSITLESTSEGIGVFSDRAQLSLRAPDQGQWCLACSHLSTSTSAVGNSDCAVESGAFVNLMPRNNRDIGPACGELDIDPWEPP